VKVTFATNFYGTVEFTESVLTLLNERAKIVFVGSMAGHIRIIKNKDLKSRFNDEDLTKEKLFALANEFAENVRNGTFEAKGWSKSAYGTSKLHINLYPRVKMPFSYQKT
jgi:NAD(P)-dependent dehydrogenase (short-subunit alcohol dehydrogenase family)